MAIGTSLGGFFNSEMEMHVAPFQEKDKGIQPETGLDTNDDNELPGNPGGMKTLEVGKKNDMPFPDNKDPRTDFTNRFGNLPPSGILNDLRKPNPDQNMPLVRKISDDGNIDVKSRLTGANVKITPEDIDTAINVGLGAGPGSIETPEKYKAYIDIFKQYTKEHLQKNPSMPFKEAVQNTVDDFHTSLSHMAGKLKDMLGALPDEVVKPAPKITEQAVSKGYAEPAYRGLKAESPSSVHEGNMYSTASPMLADMYANYLVKHPGYNIPEGTFPSNSQVMPLVINTKDYHYYDAKGAHWTEANHKAINEAKNSGKPGVIVDNVVDEPLGTHTLPPKKVFITFPEGQTTVKSRFAKEFDEHSPDMLHSIAATGIGGSLGYVAMEDLSKQE